MSEMNEKLGACQCSHRKKVRSEEELRSLTNRLRRIEGQIRGISGMLDADAYCIDILTQVSAVQSALSSFSAELLSEHIKTCVVEDIRNDRFESADELAKTVAKLMK